MFTTHCSVDITFYPFDTQLCEIKLTSWGYSTDEIELHPAQTVILADDLEYVFEIIHIMRCFISNLFLSSDNSSVMEFHLTISLDSIGKLPMRGDLNKLSTSITSSMI